MIVDRKKENANFPSIHWEKFFLKFKDIETLPINEWKDAHLLGYFCYLYKNHYGTNYTFKFNSTSPSKSFEIFKLHALMHMISSDPAIIKNYFDWFFDKKIILKKRRITSLSFIVESNSANEYKLKVLAMDKGVSIGRTTILPPQFLSIVERLKVLDCKTYGDLAFISKMELTSEYDKLLNELKLAGLDLSILDKVG